MVGSAIGASARWAISEVASTSAADGRFPWSTLLANLLGCLAIGVVSSRLDGIGRVFVVTGVLGGFTTMSAFAVEANQLVDAGATGSAVIYVAGSLIGGIGLAAAGIRIGADRTAS